MFLCVFDDPDYVSSASDYSCDVQGINLSMEPEGENLLSVAVDDDVEPNTEFTISCYGKPIITGNTAQRLPEPDWSTFRGAAESAVAADSVAPTSWGVHNITNAVSPGKNMWVRIEGEHLDRIDAALFDVTSESGIKPEYIRTDIASETVAYVYFKFNDAATGDFAMNYNGNVIFMFSFDMQTQWVQSKSVMLRDNEPATVVLKASGVIPETGFDTLDEIGIILTDPNGVGYVCVGSAPQQGLIELGITDTWGEFDVIRGNLLTCKLSDDKSEIIVNIPNGCYADNEGLYSIDVDYIDYYPVSPYKYYKQVNPIPKFLIPRYSNNSQHFSIKPWSFPAPNANMIVTARLTNNRGVDRTVQFTWLAFTNKLYWRDGTMNDGAFIFADVSDGVMFSFGVAFVDTYPNDYVFQILKIENDGQTLYSIED